LNQQTGVNPEAMTQALARAETLCQGRGVRLTDQRRQVLEIICHAERPIGAYEILDAMRLGIRKAAPTMVYRALDFLLEQGLIHRLETLHAFIGCTHPEHPHASQFLICTDCGGVRELDDASIQCSLHEAAVQSGFAPRRRVVEVIGTCADCSRTAGADPTAADRDGAGPG
jgi:Fur family zinc uptake transcriptional regulator